jgi:serine/threonine protein phosphatase PrpC
VIGNPLEAPVLTLGRCADLKAGDAFMLCSDGLWHHCNDEEFGAAIAMNSPRDAAQMLITKARKRATGGDADNCTLGVIKLIVPPKPVSNFKVDTMRRAV